MNGVQPLAHGDVLQCLELPGPHRGGADVADLAGLDDVVQRLHRLLHRRLSVVAVDLVEIYVVHVEPAQTVVDLSQDRLAGLTVSVGARSHLPVHLGSHNDVVAVGELAEYLAGDLFRTSRRVHVCGVEGGDAGVKGLLDDHPALILADRPGVTARTAAEAHAPQGDLRDLQAALAESYSVHRHVSPLPIVRSFEPARVWPARSEDADGGQHHGSGAAALLRGGYPRIAA